jgi:3-hydroxyethyl bacteriochlorophyllide a dehydrogenase
LGVAGLFGGAARRLVVSGARLVPVDASLGEQAALLALAATAYRAVAGGPPPDLIVGHGVLGRLAARVSIALGNPPPVVWENAAARLSGATGYAVTEAAGDPRCDYRSIIDMSGDARLLDTLILRLARGGEIALAGFYEQPLAFAFPPAFMREARIRISSEFQPGDVQAALRLVDKGWLKLDGLITHRLPASDAAAAYRTAFGDPACLKMILDWREMQ